MDRRSGKDTQFSLSLSAQEFEASPTTQNPSGQENEREWLKPLLEHSYSASSPEMKLG